MAAIVDYILQTSQRHPKCDCVTTVSLDRCCDRYRKAGCEARQDIKVKRSRLTSTRSSAASCGHLGSPHKTCGPGIFWSGRCGPWSWAAVDFVPSARARGCVRDPHVWGVLSF